MLQQKYQDSKVLFPHTSFKSWDENRGDIMHLCLEVEVLNHRVKNRQAISTKALEGDYGVYELATKRLYSLINEELDNYELQCQVPCYEKVSDDVSVCVRRRLAWVLVRHLSDDFCGIQGSFFGNVIYLDQNGQQAAIHPTQIEGWRLLDKRTGEYKELYWEVKDEW